MKHRPLPKTLIGSELPIYTKLYELDNTEVWLRCTFDLVYRREDGEIIARDYKTFDRSPTLDLDLDFQGRIYIATLMRKYDTHKVQFEYEYVRRTPPGIPKDKAGNCWTPEECYLTVPLVISRAEADVVWQETQWVARDILRAQREGSWYRQDRKGFMNGCSSCQYRELCVSEIQQGKLSGQTIQILSTPREPLTLPKDHS